MSAAPAIRLARALPRASVGFGSRPSARSVVLALAASVAGLSLLPLGFIASVAVQTGPERIAELVLRRRVLDLLVNTAALELCAVPLACALALALAWLTERTDLPAPRLWAALSAAPLAIPAFVHSYGWVTLAPGQHGLAAATLVSVLAYYPFLYLPIAAQLRRLDPALEESAASLGLPPSRVVLRVVLPQLRPAICGGALLVGLHLLAEYGLYAMIGFDTFTTAIVDQFQSVFDGPAANMMAGVLIVSCLGLLALESSLRGDRRYVRLGSGAARAAMRPPLGLARWALCLPPAIVAALALGVPTLTLARWLAIGGPGVWRLDLVGGALAQTAALALGGAALATLAALPIAWLSVRAPGRLQRLIETCHLYLGSLPGVVIALALVTVTVRVALPLYQTLTTLLLAYALIFLPRSLIGLRASLVQAPEELERAAAALGRTPLRAVLAVTLPLAAPGIAASMALAGLGVATELTATLLLAPNGTRTLATEFWAWSAELDYARAAPYAALMVALSVPLTILLHAQSRRLAGR